MLSIICFSKDRPLQLEGYIQSVLFYSCLPPSALSILYADTPAISYNSVIQKYPLVNWIRETNFHVDLTRLVETAHDHVLLGCDDVFFTDHFNINIPIACLVKDPCLFGFSLRLGLNLFLHSLPDICADGEVMHWEWGSAPEGHWSYPWDVSASIYRQDFILEYLKATPEATNPNRFEFFLSNSCREPSRNIPAKLACFNQSKCLTLTVNRVQDEFPNEFDESTETNELALYHAHIAGRQLDWPSFYQVKNRVIHVNSKYFRLTDIIVEPVFAGKPLPKRSIDARVRAWRFSIRLAFLRYIK
jgi:hypothetical protein